MSTDPTRASAPTPVKTYPEALRQLDATRKALTDLQRSYELIFAMATWMADRVPEIAAAAQSAAMADLGFTHHERHEGMTFGMAYGDWRALCSCGWTSDLANSIGAARIDHETHVAEVLR